MWRKSAARVVVDLQSSTTYHDDEEEDFIIVVAINIGRVATTINEVGLTYLDPAVQPRGKKSLLSESRKTGLPKRLEPGEEFQISFQSGTAWLLPVLDSASDAPASSNDTVEVRGYVRVGRETLYAPRSLTLEKPTSY